MQAHIFQEHETVIFLHFTNIKYYAGCLRNVVISFNTLKYMTMGSFIFCTHPQLSLGRSDQGESKG
jgi:hypothetical protein